MKIHELLIESTDEDRAILSLSSAIYSYIQKYSGFEEDRIDIGKIGNIFDTPLEILNDVNISLMKDDDIKNIVGQKSAVGLWKGSTDDIILNKDYLNTHALKSAIAHELRHALDDYKSNFNANREDSRYTKPIDKKFVNTDLGYYAEPAEINARFLQILHYMIPIIKRASKLSNEQQNKLIKDSLDKAFDFYKMNEIFPEKYKSKDYRRLVNRSLEFIEKELNYLKSNDNNI